MAEPFKASDDKDEYSLHEHLHARPLPSGKRSVYTPAQLTTYLRHIRFPSSLLAGPRDLRFLQVLHAHQIAFIPYENLSLHYNPAHSNSLDPLIVFDKFVPPKTSDAGSSRQRRPDTNGITAVKSGTVESHKRKDLATVPAGRGGYCLETAVFFLHVLLGLGFESYPSPARIRLRKDGIPQGPFVGFRHVTNIVTLADDGSRWSCDVGFGGDGATGPMRLVDAVDELDVPGGRKQLETSARTNLGAQQVRLVKRPMPDDDEALLGAKVEASLRGKPVWFYEYRNGDAASGQPWNAYYAFGDGEASVHELQLINDWVSLHPDSFQRHQVLVVKFIFADGVLRFNSGDSEAVVEGVDGLRLGRRGGASWLVQTDMNGTGGEGKLAGKLMLADGTLKRNLGGKSEVVKECRTEAERVAVLRDVFGIELTVEQIQGIRGFRTELKAP